MARRAQPHHIIYDKISESEERVDELKPILCKEGVTVTIARYAELEVVYKRGHWDEVLSASETMRSGRVTQPEDIGRLRSALAS